MSRFFRSTVYLGHKLSSMNPSDYWNAWFDANCPKVPASLKTKYSQTLAANDVTDVEMLKEGLELDDNYLESIEINNKAAVKSIKESIAFVSNASYKSIIGLKDMSISVDAFRPVVVVSGSAVPIEKVEKLAVVSQRTLYSGEFDRRKVIIKLEAAGAVSDELQREAAVYAALNASDNFSAVRMKYFNPTEPRYLVMDAFGENLCHFLNRNSKIRVPLLEQLLCAVNALHEASYVHLDIKPQNVLVKLTSSGSFDLKLCDFDSAQLVSVLLPSSDGRSLKYTRCWVSPELYFGTPGQTRASFSMDVFCVGLIAGLMFDDDISPMKTILPLEGDCTEYLQSESQLQSLMPCAAAPRYRHIVHQMCRLSVPSRMSLKCAIGEFNAFRATVLTEKIIELKADNNFLRQEVIGRLDCIVDEMRILSGHLKTLVDQNASIQSLLKTVIRGEYDCPTLFVMLPEVNGNKWSSLRDPLSLVQDRYRLFFLCSHTLQYAPCGPDGKSGYRITAPKAWVVKAAPYIKLGLSLVKQVLATYGIPLPIAELLNVLGGDCKLHLKYLDVALQQCASDRVDDVINNIEAVVNVDPVMIQQSIRRDDASLSEAYVSVRSILQQGGWWDSIKVTCGLQQYIWEGCSAWILRDKIVEEAFRSCVKVAECVSPAKPAEADRVAAAKPVADDEYDAIVLGTGLTECIISGLLSVNGKRVLHLDRNNYYGAETASLSLTNLYQKFRDTKTVGDNLGHSRDWNVDLIPKFIMACGKLVKILLHSKVTRYLEFKSIDGSYVFKDGKVQKVPATPAEALNSALLGFFEKRKFRNLLMFIANYEKDNPSTYLKGKSLDKVTTRQLYEEFGVDANTQAYIGHAIALHRDDEYLNQPASETAEAIQLYVYSLDRYGKSPYIYPLYGLGGMPEGFSRLCAIHGGTFMLNKGVDEILTTKDGVAWGVKTGNEIAKASIIVGDPSYFRPEKTRIVGRVIRSICILDHPIAGTDNAESVQIIIPALQVKRKNDVYVCMVSFAHNVASAGKYIAIVSTTVETSNPFKELASGFNLLGKIQERFDAVSDLLEPVTDGRTDKCFISKSYDATSHFETTADDVLSLYHRITGTELDMNISADIDEEEG